MRTISAIVPTFNRAVFLKEALAALLAQTRPLLEIIVWDDGSTDGTTEAVRALGAEGTPIRYFRSDNGGKSRALNRALAEAAGDAVWICDDDDVSRPDAAALMADAMAASGAPVVAGRYRRFGTDPATGRPVDPDPGYWPDLREGSLLRHLLEDIFLFQNATLATRAAYARVGPFREDLARSIDYDMIVRLAARHPVGFVDAVLFDQRKHPGARGPVAARHASTEMNDVWLENDQRIFLDFRSVFPLSLYEAMFESGSRALVSRAARLQRGAIYARRELWETACEEFEAAAAVSPDRALTALEIAICRRAMSGKHGCEGAFRSPTAERLSGLRAAGAAGRSIASGLALGLRWRARAAAADRIGRVVEILGLMFRLAGPTGLVHFGTRADDGPLIERRSLPAEAYSW